jgi:hypothetical protein
MCTLSVVPPLAGRGLRLVVNRDEQRTRAAAWPPRRIWSDDVAVVWPVDADSLGTWVAAAGTGLVYAVLNLNRDGRPTATRPVTATPASAAQRTRPSRGHIIPALATAHDLDEAAARFARLDVARYAPFRLFIAAGARAALHEWDGKRTSLAAFSLAAPSVLSSSGLGDRFVEATRTALFHELLERHPDPWRAQDHLHQHAWPDRRHLSVLMTRSDACTVSRTVVVMDDETAALSYAPVVDGWIGPTVTTAVTRVEPRQAVCA